jgi:hypothetical protein
MNEKPILIQIILLAAVFALPTKILAQTKKPNILVIMGDDIGYWNISAYHEGVMGYSTPNIDRLAREGGQFMPTMRSRVARQDVRPSSPGSFHFGRDCPKWDCPAPTSACARKTPPSRN